MGITKANGQKHNLDKLYTTESNARYCVEKISQLNAYDLIIEPSAGDGVFLKILKEKGAPQDKILAYDLEPEGDHILKEDWFKVEISDIYSNVLVLGNPPYGQQNTLAVKFFNHAATFANVSTIAFIIPKSFRKESLHNRLSLDFTLSDDFDLPSDKFLLEGEQHKVNTCFQIWRRNSSPRLKNVFKNETNLFSIVKDVKDADLRIQRVGGRAGKASTDLTVSAASNYWIKLDKKIKIEEKEEFINLVNQIVFPQLNNTVGPRSLSRSEMFTLIETEWKKDHKD